MIFHNIYLKNMVVIYELLSINLQTFTFGHNIYPVLAYLIFTGKHYMTVQNMSYQICLTILHYLFLSLSF